MLAALLRNLAKKISQRAPAVPSPAAQLQVAPTDELWRALAAYRSGDLESARALYEQVLRRDGNQRDALYHLGVIHGRCGNYADAAALLERVIALDPDASDAVNALGNVLQLQQRWRDAEQLYRRALAARPAEAALWVNLGLCLRDSGALDAAVEALRRALEIAPNLPAALLNLAMAQIDLGNRDEAQRLLARALELDPQLAEAHAGLAHLLLQRGEFEHGWQEYEWRFRCAGAEKQRDYPFARWNGQQIAGRTLLVRAEQGLGDQIMLASCVPDAMARAGTCLVECHPRLNGLFARSFPAARCFPYQPGREPQWLAQHPAPDFQIHLGSLPGLFRRQWADFPSHTGYLKADPARVEHWRAQLGRLGTGARIGIAWRGGAPRTRQALRSLALAQMLPLLRYKNMVFVSLQYGDCRAEIEALTRTAGVELHHWQQAIDDYEETAALVAALDVVISVQTAVVHLAGALGKPTWVLVPAIPEWRYMEYGEAMPWYPAVTLIRQQQRDNWQPVIERLATRLAART